MIWLDNALVVSPRLGFFKTAKAFRAAMREAKIPKKHRPDFLNPGANATTHWFNMDGVQHIMVCMPDSAETDAQKRGLLVHEAVHVVQHAMQMMGEDRPGNEIEAYAVQRISLALWEAAGL